MPCSEFAVQEGMLRNNCREIWQNLPIEPDALRNAGNIEQIRQNERIRMANIMAQAFADKVVNAQRPPKSLKERINDALFIGVIALVAATFFALMGALGYGMGCGIVALLGL